MATPTTLAGRQTQLQNLIAGGGTAKRTVADLQRMLQAITNRVGTQGGEAAWTSGAQKTADTGSLTDAGPPAGSPWATIPGLGEVPVPARGYDPRGPQYGLPDQTGVPEGYIRSAAGQIIPIAEAGASIRNMYYGKYGSPQAQAVAAAVARSNADLARGLAAQEQMLRQSFGGIATPERLAALGLPADIPLSQLTPNHIRALSDIGIAGDVGQRAAGLQADYAANPEWGPYPGLSEAEQNRTLVNGAPSWWTGAMAAERAEGPTVLTPELYGERYANAKPGVLDAYRRAYEQALAGPQAAAPAVSGPPVPGEGGFYPGLGPNGERMAGGDQMVTLPDGRQVPEWLLPYLQQYGMLTQPVA